MSNLQAPDGSYRVTLTNGPMNVTVDNGHGLYAPDGSYRVTIVAAGDGATGAVVSDGEDIVIGGSTYTFTVVDGVVTDIVVS